MDRPNYSAEAYLSVAASHSSYAPPLSEDELLDVDDDPDDVFAETTQESKPLAGLKPRSHSTSSLPKRTDCTEGNKQTRKVRMQIKLRDRYIPTRTCYQGAELVNLSVRT